MFIDIIKFEGNNILRIYDMFSDHEFQKHGKGLWFQGDYWTYTGLSKVPTISSKDVDNRFLQNAIRLFFEQKDMKELIDAYNNFRKN